MNQVELQQLLDAHDVRRLREVVADDPDALLVVSDRDGNVLWASDAGVDGVLRGSRAHLVGRGLDLVHPDDRWVVEQGIEQVEAGGTMDIVVRTVAQDGAWVPVHCIGWSTAGKAAVSITTRRR